jgi:hypothetical protein
MTTAIQGGCLCGAIRYEIEGKPFFEAQCFWPRLPAPYRNGSRERRGLRDTRRRIQGEAKSYSCKADNGATATRRFCPTCGSTLFSNSSSNPTMTLVHVGTFDDPTGFAPKVGVYEKQRSTWDHRDPQLACFPEMPVRR